MSSTLPLFPSLPIRDPSAAPLQRELESLGEGKASYNSLSKDLSRRVAGRFYTPPAVGLPLADAVRALAAEIPVPPTLRVIDPFCGDGRLLVWLVQALQKTPLARVPWEIHAWDVDPGAVSAAQASAAAALKDAGITSKICGFTGDAFLRAPAEEGRFHLCVTNPPWEVIKPDRRELADLSAAERDRFVGLLRNRDRELSALYPRSVPRTKFSGWGLNLARCGVEAAARLLAAGGACAVVSPASLLADQASQALRAWLYQAFTLREVHYFPAELRLFESVDQPFVNLAFQRGAPSDRAPQILRYGDGGQAEEQPIDPEIWADIAASGGSLPLQFGLPLLRLQRRLRGLPRFGDLEGPGPIALWAGRELDETGYQGYLGERGEFVFVKGRMVNRFRLEVSPVQRVRPDGPRIPPSATFARLAWRDVARPSQKRRVHAAIVPPGHVTGNSLNVAYFRDGDPRRLAALLAIVNSLVFEAQARMLLATSHLSLGVIREVRVPELSAALVESLAARVGALDQSADALTPAEAALEVEVARAYGLSREEFLGVLGSFPGLSGEELGLLSDPALWPSEAPPPAARRPRARRKSNENPDIPVRIPNHTCGSMSALDLQSARHVPPGGNWKDIPPSVPSTRLEKIRQSFARGEGSRSTYYGRLRPDAPAYTINTYFTRPGNGCHLHYDFAGGQHRTISAREAARFQSFPDSFVFEGPRGAVCDQIGNAVPPLLACQVAELLGEPGSYLDLFCGAGGMGLGFRWAGWRPLIGNDIDAYAAQTYRRNVHDQAIVGDIRDEGVFSAIASAARAGRVPGRRLLVLGGPPCQGFSTAGNRRSMDDQRNWLFEQYRDMLRAVDADGFVFENVAGLLNMEGGAVFQRVRAALSAVMPHVTAWVVRAEEHAIPQRRTRVILVGMRDAPPPAGPPPALTALRAAGPPAPLPPPPTAEETIGDLPPLQPSEDGSALAYRHPPRSPYQALMRGELAPAAYLQAARAATRR